MADKGNAQGSMRSAAARRQRVDGFVLEDHLFYLLTQIINRRNRYLAPGLRHHGAISIAKWRVLATLHARPGCSVSELADITSVDRTTLTRTLDQMVREGLVHRRPSARNRRVLSLRLSRAGERTFDQVIPLVVAENARGLAGIGAAELDALRGTLRKIIRNLLPQPAQARREPPDAAASRPRPPAVIAAAGRTRSDNRRA